MTQNKQWRTVLLVLDGLGLIGLVVFSVLAALTPETNAYMAGQILCAVLVIASTLILRHIGGPLP